MILNLKWFQENQIAKVIINNDENNFISLNENFSNAFDNDFIKGLINNCNDITDIENNSVLIDEDSIKEAPQNIKNNFFVLSEILKEFINGLNLVKSK